MPDDTRVYELVEIVGSSKDGVEQAIKAAVARTARTVQGLDWVEVQQVRGVVTNGAVSEFQVVLKVGFRVMEPEELKKKRK